MKLPFLVIAIVAGVLAASGQSNFGDYGGPVPKADVEPSYPPELLAKLPGGNTIQVFVRVSATGQAFDAVAFIGKLCNGDPSPVDEQLQNVLLDAARQTAFYPAHNEGQPIGGAYILKFKIPTNEKLGPAKPAKTDGKPPPAPAPESSTAGPHGGVVNGHAISLPKPKYPPLAHVLHVAGPVSVQVIIDEQGDIVAAYPVTGHPLLFEATADAACQAKFSPTLLSGHPVKVSGVVTYNFVP